MKRTTEYVALDVHEASTVASMRGGRVVSGVAGRYGRAPGAPRPAERPGPRRYPRPTTTSGAIPRKSPVSTTPGLLASASATACGSSMPPGNRASMM